MESLPIALAAAAGMLAVVNPCGFALLPAYASFLVMGDDSPDRPAAVRRALGFAGAMTAGFAAVFGAFGLLLSSVANIGSVQRYLPWFTVVLGVLLLGLGIWLLAGGNIPGMRFGVRGPELTRSLGSMATFGVTYALVSLTCTFVPFLATVVASFRTGSFLGGLAVFGTYALGMGLVVVSVSLAVALAQTTMVTWLRRAGRLVPRLGGGLLLVAGGYVAYYGWYEIRVLRGGAVDDPVIGVGESIQNWMSRSIDAVGVWGFAIVAAVLLALAFVVTRRIRRKNQASQELQESVQ
ncbi:cytochrome c biogenesis protein CcdA [Actinobacteria bacterium YIM 96077]|uniref:Cytochrome c biogenesis protein CcdA n=1 Tax=Phytoactinopolyspora halophila TaxID=1981511 RepID=A0A329QAV5_9ACTN|nr:cytochrome c biogenesis protein CcdA [Phytoactinopolyspora halophila]AYY13732.1 cytochrome c biogenesis protein CcdA [Actinobacteria bacterium YIM 96077]RAW09463.1 cytochrome c biogenesis protein CcdA [Phytoactinopolyspora halophila]